MNACAFILVYTREDLLDGSRGVGNNLLYACIYDEVIYAYTYSGMSVIRLFSYVLFRSSTFVIILYVCTFMV